MTHLRLPPRRAPALAAGWCLLGTVAFGGVRRVVSKIQTSSQRLRTSYCNLQANAMTGSVVFVQGMRENKNFGGDIQQH